MTNEEKLNLLKKKIRNNKLQEVRLLASLILEWIDQAWAIGYVAGLNVKDE